MSRYPEELLLTVAVLHRYQNDATTGPTPSGEASSPRSGAADAAPPVDDSRRFQAALFPLVGTCAAPGRSGSALAGAHRPRSVNANLVILHSRAGPTRCYT